MILISSCPPSPNSASNVGDRSQETNKKDFIDYFARLDFHNTVKELPLTLGTALVS